MNFPSIDIQGSILSSDLLAKIRSEQASFQQGKDFNPDLTNAKLKDEISLAWQEAKGQWTIYKSKLTRLKDGETGTTETRNFWISPLLTNLGYNLTFDRKGEELNGKSFPIGYRDSSLDNFPVYVGGYHESLDKRPENKQLRVSPHAMLQEYLNYSEHLYGLVTNGRQIRLLRDASRITRLSYVEFNLEKMMDEDLYSDFVIFYRLLHASRMPKKVHGGAESIIEQYHQQGLEAGSTIRNKLGEAVKGAIKNLANGFLNHPNNTALRNALEEGKIDSDEYYHHQLRIIYRLLFLFVIEERNLVYADSKTPETKRFNQIYYNHYSLLRLRKLAKRLLPPEADRHYDLWQSLVSTFSLFEKKEIGEKLGIMSLQGDLFGYSAISNSQYDLHQCYLSNAVLLNIIRSLSYFENDNGVLIAVNYGGLDVEEFGSVYEGLLELKLDFNKIEGSESYSVNWKKQANGREFQSHYTPEELVQPLIKHSLEYLIEDILQPYAQKKVNKEATVNSLLKLKVCDVACGSGHILLSAARRIALAVARVQTDEEQPNPLAVRKAIKEVVRNCIYGVDKNPLAVELCKIALWLEAYNPGEPLNFLDHHIKCGDAIVGLTHRNELENGIASESFKTLQGDDKNIAKSLRDKNVDERKERVTEASQLQADFEKTTVDSLLGAMEEYKYFKDLPETTPDEIGQKAQAYKKFIDGKRFTFLKAMADIQVAQFFIPKTDANKEYLMTDADFRHILRGYQGWQNRKLAKAMTLASERKFFHWFIEFPEIINDGGFDCILGNPPYLGGKKISGTYGDQYLNNIQTYFSGIVGQTDFVIFFLRRIYSIINSNGHLGLITTNSICEGDSRIGGLKTIVENGAVINFVTSPIKWPGVANLFVILIAIYKTYGSKKVPVYYNDLAKSSINSYLKFDEDFTEVKPIIQNKDLMYRGVDFGGEGYILTIEEYQSLIANDPKNNEVIFPLINGYDINNSWSGIPDRYIINFKNWELEKAREFEEPFKIIESKIKPYREKLKDKASSEKWWIYNRSRRELYEKIEQLDNCIVTAFTTKYVNFTFYRSNVIFSNALNILARNSFSDFSILSSNFHDSWAWRYSSKLKNDLRYTPSDVFETFPFPQYINSHQQELLEGIGESYYEFRRNFMANVQLGLTKIYNLFHNEGLIAGSIKKDDKQLLDLQKYLGKTRNIISFDDIIKDIIRLRLLHSQMDNAVLDAYGWNDLDLRHDFYEVDYLPENDRVRYTIHPDSRKEVLKRLLDLNHKIHSEEQALAEANQIISRKPKKLAKTKQPSTNLLFPMRPETAYAAIYSAQDVARITKVSSKTIKRWLGRLYSEGYEGISKDSGTSSQPLLINFYGVHELIVLYDLRVVNKIPLKDILDARNWLIERFGTGPNFYPFTSQKVLDTISKAGKQIIFTDEKTGDYITLGRGNVQLNLEFIKEILKRIVFDKEMVSRLYLSDSHLIAIDPNLAGGRPCTVQNEILIDSIKSVYLESKDIKYIASVYEISESAVEDALNFEKASVLN